MQINEQFGLLDDEFTERTGPGGTSVRNRRKAKDEQKVKHDSVKIRLFKIFYLLMRDRSIGRFVASILMIINFMQIFDLIISPLMKLPFKGALYNELSTIFDAIRIYPLIVRLGNADAYWFFMLKFVVLIFLYYIELLFMDLYLRKKKNPPPMIIIFLKTFSTVFFWVLVIPITDFFISIFECNNSGYLINDTKMQCWSGKHAFFCALFSLGIFLYIILLILISFLFTESRPYYTDSLRLHDNNEEIFLSIYRMVLTVVSHYTTDSSFQWLVLALHFLMSAHLIKNYLKFLPYYDQMISTLYGAGCIGYMWVAINGLGIKALETIDYRGQIIVICIGFIFMYPTAFYLRKRKIDHIVLYKQQEKIKNDLELDQFVINFQNLIQSSEISLEAEMMLLGLLFMHREECQSQTCPLKVQDQLYLPLDDSTSKRLIFPSKDKILHQHLVNSIFLEYSKSHQNSLTTVMHISYAYFLFFQMGNVHMALIELNLAQKCSSSMQQNFTIFKCKQLIEEHLVKKFKRSKNMQSLSYSELDVTIVITFEGLFARLEKAIEQSATDHIEFWSHLDSNMIDLNVINKLGLNIINQSKKVIEIWNQLKKINPNYPNALNLYGTYLCQIKNDYEQGEEFKNTYLVVKRMKSIDNFENQYDIMFAEDTTVIVMSGNKEQQGKIIKTNQGIQKLFGYSMFEVQGHDVNVLMPPVIAMRHNFFVEKFIKTGKERILNKCLDSFAMFRTGTIFPIALVVKPVPSLRNDIQYIGMIKRSEKEFEYIITDENGKIDSISDGIVSIFKLPISFFKEHEIPVQIIVPELCEVSKMKGPTKEPITNLQAFNGVIDLRYRIPKNFSSSANRASGIPTSSTVKGMGVDGTTDDGVTGSGATGTGTGTHTQTSSSSKAKNLLSVAAAGQGFTGLKNPESLKSVSNMFKNAEHKANPEKYKNNLYNHVNYNNPDFDKVIKTEMQTILYSDGDLVLKVFKLFIHKKKKGQAGKRVPRTRDSSSSSLAAGKDEETMMHEFGLYQGMSTLNDKFAFQKYKELIQKAKHLDASFNYKRLQHDIDVLKILLERQRKVRTNGNIMTPVQYEQAELDRMISNIQILEAQISEITSESSKVRGGQTTGTEKSSGGLSKGPNQKFHQNWGQQLMTDNQVEKAHDSADENAVDQSSFNVNAIHKVAMQIEKIDYDRSNQENQDSSKFPHPTPNTLSPNFNQQEESKSEPENEQEQEQEYGEESDLEGESQSRNLDIQAALKLQLSKPKKGEKTEQPKLSTGLLGQNIKELSAGQGTLKNVPGTKKSKNNKDDYTYEYFQQANLLGVSGSKSGGGLNLDIPGQNINKRRQIMIEQQRKQEVVKQAYQVDLQNEILRNLHEKNKFEKAKSRRDENSSALPEQEMSSSTAPNHEGEQAQFLDEKQDLGIPDNNSLKIVEETGSVTSDTKTLMRHLRVLRNALYENYSPQSIQNLKYSARFVLAVLIAMTISSFIFSKQKYNQLTNNFYMIQASEQRMQSITTINSDVRACVLMSNNILNINRTGQSSNYFTEMTSDIDQQAIILQKSQTNLSTSPYDFSEQYQSTINAEDIVVLFNTYQELGTNQTLDIWSATMQLSTFQFKLKNYNLTQFNTSSLEVFYTLTNSMNSILEAVSGSTQGILDDTGLVADSNKRVLMILLLVASGCLLASMIIIMPVVTKVHKDKDKLLSLFLMIDSNDVKNQLKHCKDFFSTFDKNSANVGEQGYEFEDEEKKEGEEGATGEKKKDDVTPSSEEDKKLKEEKQKEQQQMKRFQRKGKKHKKYSTNYFMLLLKFLIVITVLEGYFLYQYFQSDHFLRNSLNMIGEAAAIANRRFSNFLLYQVFIDILATNGTALVFNQNSINYIKNYIGSFNQELENFLAIHSNNTGIHDSTFNSFFNNLIYQSVCSTISSDFTKEEQDQCGTYLGGILNKGLYSANLAYWDNIREMMDSYIQSSKQTSFIKGLINSDRLVQNEQLNLVYFSSAYNLLMNKLNQSILVQFENRNKELTIMFAVYLFLLILMYFILWGRFVESMRHSLWVTKSMLAIIPLEVIEKVKAIKEFLMEISRAAMSSIKE